MDVMRKLERRIGRFELLAVVMLTGCATVTLTALASPEPTTLRAQRFEMVDADGRVRGYWRMSDDGSPFLTLYDAEGKSRVALSAAPSGASEVTVTNASGASIRIRVEADGRTSPATVPLDR